MLTYICFQPTHKDAEEQIDEMLTTVGDDPIEDEYVIMPIYRSKDKRY